MRDNKKELGGLIQEMIKEYKLSEKFIEAFQDNPVDCGKK